MVVGHTLRRPDAAHLGGALAEDFHLPHLAAVGNGDALAAVAIAILLHQRADEVDGFARRSAAHQCHTLQLFDGEHAFLVDQRVGAAEGGLADGQLVLVEAGIGCVEVGVGVGHLRYGAHLAHAGGVAAVSGVHRAAAHGVHRASLVVGGRFHIHPGAVATVAGVRRDDAAVGRGALAHHN